MEDIKLIRNIKDTPSVLSAKSIVMNGLEKDIHLGSAKVYAKHFFGIQQGVTLTELKEFAENCAAIGALLAYNGVKYTIWNGDDSATDYWDPFSMSTTTPQEKYGRNIAVCVGNGIWATIGWKGLDTTEIEITIDGNTNSMYRGSLYFANNETDLYYSFCRSCIKGSGYDNTKHIFTDHGSEIAQWNHPTLEDGVELSSWDESFPTLWDELQRQNLYGLKDWQLDSSGEITQFGDLYIPNKLELQEINWNCSDKYPDSDLSEDSQYFTYENNLGKLLGLSNNSYYWSSSQYPDDYSDACNVYFYSGFVESDVMDSYYLSVACIHF